MLNGCDVLLDCIDADGPVFDTSAIDVAVLNQVYTQEIVASVENEPFDSRFVYNFAISDGTLPPGISATAVSQKFILTGTALQLGSFPFKLSVAVDDGISPQQSNLCYRSRDRDFNLTVVQDSS